MSTEFNHTIVRVRDKHAGAWFLADLLGHVRRWATWSHQSPLGGRGVYFNDPDGHAMELLTRTPDSDE